MSAASSTCWVSEIGSDSEISASDVLFDRTLRTEALPGPWRDRVCSKSVSGRPFDPLEPERSRLESEWLGDIT